MQITLNAADYPASVLGTDTLKMTAAHTAFPPLAPMTTGSWDMSVVSDSLPLFFTSRVATDTPFLFADSLLKLSYLNSFVFIKPVYYFDTNSLDEFGFGTIDTSYSLAYLTTVITDSLIFPAQQVIYTVPEKVMGFPVNYGDVWGSSYVYDVNYQLSYSFYSYDHAPGYIRSYVTDTERVTGWGKMRVKDITGSPSAWWNVLQVERMKVKRDSFFLNSAPMPNALLTTFSITQGVADTTYEQLYYRIGEVTPLARVEFKDAAFTQPYSATTHVQRLIPYGVEEVANDKNLSVFPNPVKGHTVSVVTSGLSGALSYRLTDAGGKLAAEGSVNISNNHGIISLSGEIAGSYFLQLCGPMGKTQTIHLTITR